MAQKPPPPKKRKNFSHTLGLKTHSRSVYPNFQEAGSGGSSTDPRNLSPQYPSTVSKETFVTLIIFTVSTETTDTQVLSKVSQCPWGHPSPFHSTRVHRCICHLQSILFKASQCRWCFVTRFLHGCSQTPIPSHFSIVPSVFSRLCHTRTTAQFPTSLAAQAQSWPLCSSRHWPTEFFLRRGTWISGAGSRNTTVGPMGDQKPPVFGSCCLFLLFQGPGIPSSLPLLCCALTGWKKSRSLQPLLVLSHVKQCQLTPDQAQHGDEKIESFLRPSDWQALWKIFTWMFPGYRCSESCTMIICVAASVPASLISDHGH